MAVRGHAHALNLHESGVDVIVGLYQGSKSWAKSGRSRFDGGYGGRSRKRGRHIIMMLVNDEKQAKLYKESIEPNLTEERL